MGDMRPFFLIATLCLIRVAAAQPADCPTEPSPGQQLPLWLDMKGLPGVPRGAAGLIGVAVPGMPTGGVTACPAEAAPPRNDVLRGRGGDLLSPGGRHDLLRGPRPRVEMTFPARPLEN